MYKWLFLRRLLPKLTLPKKAFQDQKFNFSSRQKFLVDDKKLNFFRWTQNYRRTAIRKPFVSVGNIAANDDNK